MTNKITAIDCEYRGGDHVCLECGAMVPDWCNKRPFQAFDTGLPNHELLVPAPALGDSEKPVDAPEAAPATDLAEGHVEAAGEAPRATVEVVPTAPKANRRKRR